MREARSAAQDGLAIDQGSRLLRDGPQGPGYGSPRCLIYRPAYGPLGDSVPEDAALTCAGDELAIMPRNVASRRSFCWIVRPPHLGIRGFWPKGAIHALYGRTDIAVVYGTMVMIVAAFLPPTARMRLVISHQQRYQINIHGNITQYHNTLLAAPLETLLAIIQPQAKVKSQPRLHTSQILLLTQRLLTWPRRHLASSISSLLRCVARQTQK